MRELLLGIFLGGCAWTDGRKREISLLWLAFWAVAGGVYFLAGMWGAGAWDMDVESVKRASGIFAGLFLLAAALASKGQVGIGDGLVFLVCGLFLDFWESSLLLMGGLLLLVGKQLLGSLWRQQGRGRERPLLPYVFAAYIGGLVWNL